MLDRVFPWQTEAWREVFEDPERLSGALLISGPAGIGKLQFTRLVAQALLCERPEPLGYFCDACQSCHWNRLETHPDLKLLQPQSLVTDEVQGEGNQERSASKVSQGGRQISVWQVRELSGFLGMTAHRRGRKIVVVHPAEHLNSNAANALLKTLEEPPPQTSFLLVSHRPHRIFPTVRSRCRKVTMRTPTAAESVAWLAEQGVPDPLPLLSEAGFAPLLALDNADGHHLEQRRAFLEPLVKNLLDPVGHAADQAGGELPKMLGWLQKWTYDLVANRLAGCTRYNLDFSPALERISEHADIVGLGRLYRTLLAYQSRVEHPLNSRLLLEHLFVSYLNCFGSQAK